MKIACKIPYGSTPTANLPLMGIKLNNKWWYVTQLEPLFLDLVGIDDVNNTQTLVYINHVDQIQDVGYGTIASDQSTITSVVSSITLSNDGLSMFANYKKEDVVLFEAGTTYLLPQLSAYASLTIIPDIVSHAIGGVPPAKYIDTSGATAYSPQVAWPSAYFRYDCIKTAAPLNGVSIASAISLQFKGDVYDALMAKKQLDNRIQSATFMAMRGSAAAQAELMNLRREGVI